VETGEFETLAKKVELAASLIESLKRECEELKSELHGALERAGKLEKDLSSKSENISVAGERIRGLVSRLEAALA
jgi:FtsZ-binding cell division protein ZapB